MLTIPKALNAAKAQTYHKTEFAAPDRNYWQQGAQTVGQWSGTLAQELGLSGEITAEDFAKMSEGLNPHTGAVLVRSKASTDYLNAQGRLVSPVEHRAGWDATFSAPKSVSLVALVGGDDRVREAHREAAAEALRQFETYAHARLGGNTPAERTGRLAIATFEHDTARPVDGYTAPQLHTHNVVFNVTRRDDGSTRGLESRALFDTQAFATAVYQSELTSRLRSLGYEIEPGKHGAPEIKGITRAYIEASSPGAGKIREYMTEHGLSGPEAAQQAAYSVREKKVPLDREVVLAAHQKIAAQHGNQAEQVIAAARQRGSLLTLNPDERTAEAITYAKHRSFEREAVTDERLLMRDALRHGMGHIRYADVKPAFEARIETGEFLAARGQKYSSGRLYTTPATIAQERQAVQSSLEGQSLQVPIVSPERAASYAQGLPRLNDGQRTAIETVLSSTDRVQGLQGLAGTGKTTTLRAIREAAEQSGYAVEGFAPTSKASQQLREAGVSADTLQGFLVRGGQAREQSDPASRHLYMLDESSIASTRQMRDFLERIGPRDRVLVIGDTRQHQGVDAGKPFEQMQDAGLHTAHLDKIMRQKEPGLLAAVEHLANNETKQGIAMLAAQGRVHEVQDREERVAAIATAYAQRPEGTIIVSPDNASRRAINQAVRAELQDRGALSPADTTLPTLIPRSDLTGADRRWAPQYQAGDVVYYPRGSTPAAIPPRSYATVTAIDRDANTLTVALPSGETRSYDPRRLHGVSVYQEIERPFASGERIQFTAPSQALGVANRDMATITRIEGTQVTARVDGGDVPQHVRFDAREMRHFDHGYAVTSHSSQSATADRVLVNMDTRAHPDLISTRFAYVAISRASQQAQVFTNDAAALGQRLSRDVSKSSAVDFKHGQEASTNSYSQQSPAIDSSYALGL